MEKPEKKVYEPEMQNRIYKLMEDKLKEIFDSDDRIDEVRIYDRSINEGEIQELFENPSGLTRALIFGKITELNAAAGNFITFEAENLRCLSFSPFEFNQFSAGEKVRCAIDYRGLLMEKFSIGVFKVSIK